MWLLRKVLFPVSLVYGLVVYLRNRCYDWGLFPSESYQTPIICIGNLNVGGTGKTPMVELLISLLQEKYKVAVLSRGYRRKSRGFVLANADSTVNDLGDEPYQIHMKFKNIQVAVDADRQNGIALLEKDVKPDVILMDDAFQHRKVKPGFSILLTAFDSLYTSDWYLPSGNLRDSRREARRADILVVTKNPLESTYAEHIKIKHKLGPKPHQKTLFSYLDYDRNLQGNRELKHIDDLKGKKITLVTGIANPNPLTFFLEENGILFEHLSFKDHHNFNVQEIEMIKSKPNVLTTEKDFVRLKNDVTCNYIEIKHLFFDQGLDELKTDLEEFMSQYS
ncbi:tetraacyldisaccharide 4'-kinase [Maribacter algarum]|uniref:Tetraacyldisaccharide 4'-kinase n=1 Tax=Maribacter algarum (ex Zhang et al. 2020) TaxID=2578118 RepID=A0A5S3PNQ7_9FLAO|nr:tetraacyldisaccharide 4'-kinase [Maribacter algarum]TMM56112.1 tetraacyldisaccharide 4'-kinase [Maribacter algarum]